MATAERERSAKRASSKPGGAPGGSPSEEAPARISDSPSRAARFIARAWHPLRVFALIALVLGLATARVVFSGEAEIAASTEALRAGQAREAAVRARRAAGHYVPGAPHVRVAYERLVALARRAEELGDRDLSLFAWRGVRSAALESRWLVQPHAGDLALANAAIARLAAAAPRPIGARTEPASRIEARHLEALLRDEAPARPWLALLAGGFGAVVTGGALTLRRGVGTTGRVDLRRAALGLALAALGAALWLVAAWRA